MKLQLARIKNLLSVAIIIGFALYCYWGLWNIFFQQDEWLGLGNAIARNQTNGFEVLFQQVFNGNSARFLPMSAVFGHTAYSLFGTNFTLYGILALVLLIANSVLSYFTLKKLTGHWQLGLAASLLLISNNNFYFSVTWIATLIPSQFCLLFFMLSLFFLSHYLETKIGKYLILAMISMLNSLTFKESGIFYLPVFWFLVWFPLRQGISTTLANKVKLSLILTLPLVLFLFLNFLFSNKTVLNFSSASLANNPLNNSPAISVKYKALYNAFLLPARSLSQVYFNFNNINNWTQIANNVHYSKQLDGFVVGSIIGDSLSLLMSFYVLMVVFCAVIISGARDKKVITFSLFSFFLSTLPFVIFKNDAAMLELRYFLFPSLWASILLVSVIFAFFSKFRRFKWTLLLTVCLGLSLYHLQWVKSHLASEIQVGNYRHEILDKVAEIKPQLGKDIIFYFFTGHTGFYEFQSGFGQTLAVWLYDTDKIPREALTDLDFWDSGYEGVKEFRDGKYGYFMTYEKLLKYLKEDTPFDLSNVHSFYWDYQKHTVTDVSNEIRLKLERDLSK